MCLEQAAKFESLQSGKVKMEADAEDFPALFVGDVRALCSLAGHLHEHENTCYKYAPEGSRRQPPPPHSVIHRV